MRLANESGTDVNESGTDVNESGTAAAWGEAHPNT